jgi:hypothetical protein
VNLFEKKVAIPIAKEHRHLIEHIEKAVSFNLSNEEIPLRIAITSVDENHYYCEICFATIN